jgi:hypothetical protein
LVLPFIVVICLCGTFCLAPLALYLMWLGRVTRHERPTPVAGPWDYAGVLFGLSGFVVVGGGIVLSLFQSNFRYWMRGHGEAFRAAWSQESTTWLILVGFYLALVLGSAAVTLAGRRRTLVVYNVEPGAFEAVLREVFEHLGHAPERRGKVWAEAAPLCEVDAFETGYVVTLRWLSGDDRLFEEVVRQLRAALASHVTAENAVTHWLTAGAVGTGVLAVCFFGLLLYGLSLMAR